MTRILPPVPGGSLMLPRSWRAGDEDDLAEPVDDDEEVSGLPGDEDDVLDEDDAGVPDGLPADVEGPEAD